MVGEENAAADYEAALSDLTFNSKPHINMLTMLAEENVQFAPKIVEVIEAQLHKVPSNQVLPLLYLMDSIVKNLPNSSYKELFNKNLINTFVTAFEKTDEKTRASLFKLRDTWSGYFAPSKLYGIDIKVHSIDRAWPVREPDRIAATNSRSSSDRSAVANNTSKSIYVNPDFLKSTKSTGKDGTRSSNGSSNNDIVETRQRELQKELEQKKRELDRLTRKANQTSTGGSVPSSSHHGHLQSVVTVPPPSNQRDPRLSRGGNSQHRSVGSHRSERGNGRGGSYNSRSGDRESSRAGSAEATEKRHQQQQRYQDVDLRTRNSAPLLPPKKRKPQSPAAESEPESSVSKEKKKRVDLDIKQESPFPFDSSEDQDLRVLYRPHPPAPVRVKEEIVEEVSVVEPVPSGIREHTPTPDITPPISQTIPIPTTSPSQVTAKSIVDRKPPVSISEKAGDTNNVRISIDAPEITDNSLGTLLAHRDTILQRTEQQLTEGQISRQQYNDIVRDFNYAMDTTQTGPPAGAVVTRPRVEPFLPIVTTSSIRPLLSTSVSAPSFNQVTITRDGPGLEPVPANNRIFVDGRAYEVRYIEDVAVIERNGLPHRIYFVGTPRDVVIDGYAHTLAFGESKTISVDGQPQVIRFGAPSKELYMGPHPIRGAFGGPPVRATINGVPHKIQLCGPPPEVKIDPEPAYELLRYVRESHMARPGSTFDQSYNRRPALVPLASSTLPMGPGVQFSQQQRLVHPAQFPFGGPPRPFIDHHQQRPVLPVQPQLPQLPQLPKLPQSLDVRDLYSKLVNTGIILNKQQPPPLEPVRSATPPIPSKIRFGDGEVVERKSNEPDLCDFAPGKIKVRYVSVIEALYKQKTQCSICGMRFPDSERQKYSKHLDWHFRQSRREKDRSHLRPWYLMAEDWIRHEEVADDSAPKAVSAVFENSQKQQQQQGTDSGRMLVASTDSVIPATDDSQECTVCGEKFEQFWDEDEEVWKMRNAVLIKGKAYHPLCYQDIQSTDVEPGDAPSFAPLPEDFMASNSSGEESKPAE